MEHKKKFQEIELKHLIETQLNCQAWNWNIFWDNDVGRSEDLRQMFYLHKRGSRFQIRLKKPTLIFSPLATDCDRIQWFGCMHIVSQGLDFQPLYYRCQISWLIQCEPGRPWLDNDWTIRDSAGVLMDSTLVRESHGDERKEFPIEENIQGNDWLRSCASARWRTRR
jgi:hypothetical protein